MLLELRAAEALEEGREGRRGADAQRVLQGGKGRLVLDGGGAAVLLGRGVREGDIALAAGELDARDGAATLALRER